MMRATLFVIMVTCLLAMPWSMGCRDGDDGDGDADGDSDGDADGDGILCGTVRCPEGERCCDHCSSSCIPEMSGAWCPDDEDPDRDCGDGGVDGDADSDADAEPPTWTDCDEAARLGIQGDPCEGDFSCTRPGPCCDDSVRCQGGLLNFGQVCRGACGGPPWVDCRPFFDRHGDVGDSCEVGVFGPCEYGEDCCRRRFTCSGDGLVLDEITCGDSCFQEWCPGYTPPLPDTELCRADEQCSYFCLGTGDYGPCASCRTPTNECTSNEDCEGELVCQEYVDTCSDCSPGATGTECSLSCSTGERTCPDWQRCRSNGTCEYVPCNDGWICQVSATCDTGSPDADLHGCVLRPCTEDTDCDCGACVKGRCRNALGRCAPMLDSDVNLKRDFELVDRQDVLRRLSTLPITTWRYRTESGEVRHMGAMAQDFSDRFNLGSNDRQIAVVDALGVTMAALQGLHQEVEQLSIEQDRLRRENRELRSRLAQTSCHR